MNNEPVLLRKLIYHGLQLAAKVFSNSFYGVFGIQTLSIVIIVYRTHNFLWQKVPQIHGKTAHEKFGLKVVYGFTDSIFVKGSITKDNNDAFIKYYRENYDDY